MKVSRLVRPWRARPLSLALACAVVVAGCGGNDFARRSTTPGAKVTSVPTSVFVRNPALRAQLTSAAARTEAKQTARTSISVTLTGLGKDALSSGAFDVAGTGVVDFRNGNADVSVSIPAFDGHGEGTIEQRIVGGVVYTRLPRAELARAGLPASVLWLSLDPARANPTDPAALSQAQVSPAAQLAFLAAASTDVRALGPDPVRGVPATHYAATIEPAGITGAVRARLAPLAAAIGGRRIAVDVWLDVTGTARRVVVSVPLAARSGVGGLDRLGPDAMMRIQADFFAFGTPARVVAPPPAQVRAYTTIRLDRAAG